MSDVLTETAAPPLKLHLGPLVSRFTEDEFFEFCQLNRDLRIELSAEGDLIVMPPTGATTGARNASLTAELYLWAKKDGTGVTFDSSTGFTLPNGAKRSPDAAWIRYERWNGLTDKQQEKFPPLCPEFVVELRSLTDSVSVIHEKMREYIENGAELGWLIDPYEHSVFIYRPGRPAERLDKPATVSGEPVLKGFVLYLEPFWAIGSCA